MQSMSAAACLRRGLVAVSRSSRPTPKKLVLAPQCLRLGQGARHHRVTPPRLIESRRAISTSTPRRFADAGDNFDPKSVERESDQVDVCIVGGGMFQC
jgi:electron-transferring-flavoprotein dehydrogenase